MTCGWVLAHFEPGGGDAAGVRGLTGGIEQTVCLDDLYRLGGQRHIRALEDGDAAVIDELLRAIGVHLVLGCAGGEQYRT